MISMIDLKVVENGDGGDLEINGNDLAVINSFQNMIYLALFGGNIEQSTPSIRVPGEQNFDYWANSLLFGNDPSIQFNSETERTLNQVALSSSGRVQIEQAVKNDLKFMEDFAEVTVSVSLLDADKIKISVSLKELSNTQVKVYSFLWDAAKLELIEE